MGEFAREQECFNEHALEQKMANISVNKAADGHASETSRILD